MSPLLAPSKLPPSLHLKILFPALLVSESTYVCLATSSQTPRSAASLGTETRPFASLYFRSGQVSSAQTIFTN